MTKIVDDAGDFLVDDEGNFLGETTSFTEEVQKFSPSNIVILFALDCTEIGGEILRFTGSVDEKHTSPIIFDGNLYAPMPVMAEGFEKSSSGTLPQPKLKVLNTPQLQGGVIALKDMIGATLYRIKTFKTFLDDGDTPDPEAHFPIDIFKINRKSNSNRVYIEWELAAAMDQEGRMIPGRQVIKDYCTHIYRRYDTLTGTFIYDKATCPYVGAPSFNEKDQSVPSSQDRCGKRLSSCKLRFGATAQLPTRAFPGVAQVR